MLAIEFVHLNCKNKKPNIEYQSAAAKPEEILERLTSEDRVI